MSLIKFKQFVSSGRRTHTVVQHTPGDKTHCIGSSPAEYAQDLCQRWQQACRDSLDFCGAIECLESTLRQAFPGEHLRSSYVPLALLACFHPVDTESGKVCPMDRVDLHLRVEQEHFPRLAICRIWVISEKYPGGLII